MVFITLSALMRNRTGGVRWVKKNDVPITPLSTVISPPSS